MGKVNDDGTSASVGKTFSENTVAILLMALNTTSISATQYDMMSALDGQRTASAFQHQFRSVLRKAKELKGRVDDGEKLSPVPSSKKRGASALDATLTPPATPKKPKVTPKPRTNKSKSSDDSDSPPKDLSKGGALTESVEDMLKQELAWESEI